MLLKKAHLLWTFLISSPFTVVLVP